MVGKRHHPEREKQTTGADYVSPDNTHKGETVFRLRVGYFSGHPILRGSYPFCENRFPYCKLADKQRETGKFKCPIINGAEPENYFCWSGDQKKYYCKDCKHLYEKLEVSYRKGSFFPFDGKQSFEQLLRSNVSPSLIFPYGCIWAAQCTVVEVRTREV